MILNENEVMDDVRRALREDVGPGDITADLLSPSTHVHAEILSREPMLLCGRPWVEEVFHRVDPSIQLTWLAKEGTWLDQPQTLCSLSGRAQSILTAERTALNFLQTLSATATQTYRCVQSLQGLSTRVLDTRKTIPGLRYAQKYAVRLAGGVNHRLGLYDAYLIKENHIRAFGSITAVIQHARALRPAMFLEIEVETLEEFQEALDAKPDRILLDNFTLPMLEQAVLMNRHASVTLEASGGIDKEHLIDVARTGVDYISMGSLTKSIQAIDLSLLIKDEQ
ncbi:MAG: carboxylating nicotinate-nucleotide diphosphorylase [Legionellaceae bacterium]